MSARRTHTVSKVTEKAEKAEVIEKPEKVIKAPKAEKVEKAPKAEKITKDSESESEQPKVVAEKVTKKKVTKKEEAVEEASQEPEAQAETTTEEVEEDSIEKRCSVIMELVLMNKKSTDALYQETKKLLRDVLSERKKTQKIIAKTNSTKKQRTGAKGVEKLVPIQTAEFRTFVEKNYQQLSDKNGNQIITTLTYDDNDGSLLIGRASALSLVIAYAKLHNLQQYEDKKRIKMDKTLQKLFPKFAERKESDGSVKEEDFYFKSIMEGLTAHLPKKVVKAE